jgi:hypothetical protein
VDKWARGKEIDDGGLAAFHVEWGGQGWGLRLGVLQVGEEEGVGSATARRAAGDPGQRHRPGRGAAEQCACHAGPREKVGSVGGKGWHAGQPCKKKRNESGPKKPCHFRIIQ